MSERGSEGARGAKTTQRAGTRRNAGEACSGATRGGAPPGAAPPPTARRGAAPTLDSVPRGGGGGGEGGKGGPRPGQLARGLPKAPRTEERVAAGAQSRGRLVHVLHDEFCFASGCRWGGARASRARTAKRKRKKRRRKCEFFREPFRTVNENHQLRVTAVRDACST